MADVDGQIVLGLDIEQTTQRMNQDLNRVLTNIGKKEIVLNAKIENINFGNAASQIRNVTNQINQEFNSTLNIIDLVNGGIGNLSRMLQGAGFSKGSISTVTQDLQRMSLQISKITTTMNQNGNISLRINGTDELQRAVTIIRQYDSETGKVVNTSKTFVQSFKNASKAASDFAKSVEQIKEAISTNKIEASIANVTLQYEKLGSTGHEKLSEINTDLQILRNIQQTLSTTTDNTVLVESYTKYEQVLEKVKNSLSIVTSSEKGQAVALREGSKAAKEAAVAYNTLQKSTTLSNKIEVWMKQSTRAAKEYESQLKEIQKALLNNSDTTIYQKASVDFARIQSEAKKAGLTISQFATSVKDAGLQLLGLSSGIMIMQKLISVIREGANVVVELDNALVDLQKTSTATPQQLASFYREANDMAKKFGTTTKDIIQGTADWSRLGYNLTDSKTMAQMSSMFASISPGMSVDDATSGLISAMKAFGIEADNVLDDIMSKINIVGNNFAVSNNDIVEGLQRSASAMAAMEEDFDSTIALFTAANETLQDAASTGTALRSMSLRIRGFDEETEELSEDLVDITGKIVDYTKTAKNAQGVSIFTDASQEHFKDFVTYFRELSTVWNDMSEKNRTSLLNDLFGKRGAQAGAALIKNFRTVEEALDKMANSAGNAEAEMKIITESLTYKLNSLKETATGIFQNLFQREDIGIVIDVLTNLLSLIDTLTDHFGLFGTAIFALTAGGVFKSLA